MSTCKLALCYLTLWSSWQPFISLSTQAVNRPFTFGVHYLHPAVLHFLVCSKVNVYMQQTIKSANISWARDLFQFRWVVPACHACLSSCIWHKRCRNLNFHIDISNPSHVGVSSAHLNSRWGRMTWHYTKPLFCLLSVSYIIIFFISILCLLLAAIKTTFCTGVLLKCWSFQMPEVLFL